MTAPDTAMEQERARYIADALAGRDGDWAGWGDAVADLAAIGGLVMAGKQDEAQAMVRRLVVDAADRHVEKLYDSGRFDGPPSLADVPHELRAMARSFADLEGAIRTAFPREAG